MMIENDKPSSTGERHAELTMSHCLLPLKLNYTKDRISSYTIGIGTLTLTLV